MLKNKLQYFELLQAHGGKFACLYCESERELKGGKIRTFGDLRKRHEQFLKAGGKLRDASKYANCINRCLLNEDDETRVIDVVPPEELHLLMGGVHVHLNLLIEIFGLQFVEKWTSRVGVIRHGYQGGGYDGVNSKRILNLVDDLAAYLPPNCAPIIASLRAFKSIVEGC